MPVEFIGFITNKESKAWMPGTSRGMATTGGCARPNERVIARNNNARRTRIVGRIFPVLRPA